jgi:NADH-quinone oxidoreductase subunit N
MLTVNNLLAFAPQLWLLAGAFLILGLGRISGARTAPEGAVIGVAAIIGAFFALVTQFRSSLSILDGAFLVDGYSLFFDVLVLTAAALTLLAGLAYSRRLEGLSGDFAGFVLLAALGAMLTASAGDMIALFASVELLSLNLYVMAALVRREWVPTQAALKYMLAGLTGSAVLAYGLAMLYGLTGETSLRAVGTVLTSARPDNPAVLLALTLVVGGFALKLGVAPLQWWVPEVFDAAPLPVLVFMVSGGLAALFAALVRLTEWSFGPTQVAAPALLALLAALTMTAGNLAALFENRLRRILAYSTIAQLGYGLAALVALKQSGGIAAALILILGLSLSSVAALIAVLGYQQVMESEQLADLAGMSRHAPGLALLLGLAVASLIGAPPLAGFFGKFLVAQWVTQAGLAWLAILLLLNTLISAIYYLRILKVAFIDPSPFELDPVHHGRALWTALAALTAGLLLGGLFLGPMYSAATNAAKALLH